MMKKNKVIRCPGCGLRLCIDVVVGASVKEGDARKSPHIRVECPSCKRNFVVRAVD